MISTRMLVNEHHRCHRHQQQRNRFMHHKLRAQLRRCPCRHHRRRRHHHRHLQVHIHRCMSLASAQRLAPVLHYLQSNFTACQPQVEAAAARARWRRLRRRAAGRKRRSGTVGCEQCSALKTVTRISRMRPAGSNDSHCCTV